MAETSSAGFAAAGSGGSWGAGAGGGWNERMRRRGCKDGSRTDGADVHHHGDLGFGVAYDDADAERAVSSSSSEAVPTDVGAAFFLFIADRLVVAAFELESSNSSGVQREA